MKKPRDIDETAGQKVNVDAFVMPDLSEITNKKHSTQDIILTDLDLCISEARRFIGRAVVAKKAIESGDETTYHSKANAAAKRASLDLSGYLSLYRKGPYRRA